MDIHTRFQGADYMPIASQLPITLIGNGGIGSWLGLGLARLGVAHIYNYELDVVEEPNIGGQFYSLDDIGSDKATVFAEKLESWADYYNVDNLGFFKESNEVTPITFCAVDNNDARRQIYNAWYKQAEADNWVFTIKLADGTTITLPHMLYDGRMSFTKYDVYMVKQLEAVEHGEYYIPPSKMIATDDCAAKANPMVGMLCAGMMWQRFANAITNVIAYNEGWTNDVVSTPWRTRHDLLFNLNKTDLICSPPTLVS